MIKCYDSLNGDKKYGQMVRKIRKCIYGSGNFTQTVSTGKSITNTYSQKTLSSIKPRI